MSVLLRAAYSIIVVVIVALALPVSQLRTVSVKVECCCPDPSKCHCPDHDTHKSDQSTIKACHKSAELLASPTVPDFVPPSVDVVSAPMHVIASIVLPPAEPHESPSPDRPSGPS